MDNQNKTIATIIQLALLLAFYSTFSFAATLNRQTIERGLAFSKQPPLTDIIIPQRYLDDSHSSLVPNSELEKDKVYSDYLAGWNVLQELLAADLVLLGKADEKPVLATWDLIEIHCKIRPEYCNYWADDLNLPDEERFRSWNRLVSYRMKMKLLTPQRLKETMSLFKSVFANNNDTAFQIKISINDSFKMFSVRKKTILSFFSKLFKTIPREEWEDTLDAYKSIDLFCRLKEGIDQEELQNVEDQDYMQQLSEVAGLCTLESTSWVVPDAMKFDVYLLYPSMTAYYKNLYLSDEISRVNKKLGEANNEEEIISAIADMTRRLTALHPFYDGNGRTIRMFANYILMLYGLAPAAFDDFSPLPKTRAEWQEVFKQAQSRGEKLLTE